MTPAVQRADAAVREAWSGQHHTTELRGIFYAPPARPGGATDALIRLAVPTALAAALDVEEMARVLATATWPDGSADGFPSKRVAEMLAAELRAAILGSES